MEIEIATIGGYEEVGRQMTAVRAGDDVVVFDMGLNLSQVLIHDNVETEKMHSLDLIDMGAIPDDRVMSDLEGDVKAIVPTHGHLDHIGAISKLAHRYDAPIVASPFTIELVKQQVEGENKFNVGNDLVKMEAGEMMSIGDSGNVELEFVHVTHSIIDAINPVLHTPEGAIVYGLDKRMDHSPVLEDPIDMKRFREIGREGNGVLAYIEDCTNAGRKGRTPSESVARKHLEDVIRSVEDYDGGIVATTFSSHVSRVSSIVEFAKDIGRQPVLLGRSMEKYSGTAERLGFVDFPDDVGMYGHRKSVDRTFKRIMKEGKENFLPIVTGHQGEPRAMLTRMGRGETPYEIENGDKVIFSARVIPEPTNEGQRYQSERLLKMQGARIYDDIHVSGHLREEGHYQMLDALQPQHVIPAHQNLKGFSPYVDLCESQGYDMGRDLHVTRNGNMIQLVE
ncbi:hydrolase of the metallo-beta-lactamase superfamily protein [Halogeometricum borinquense DSM 11551]|uniref:Ribonuclease J n=1 Tax=Halogeometricum borinquense (strain ATCC 700274 / DSM 11551 / JCM 10706 / KCTC 4070 / PR3) TaxID=469382 RepID=E4NR45_HALBP|nr:ribonuclease J [Halogeometricum borinquense]ADQ66781.1 predicted hydrolase of the metallo-beta-lactamase superfamily [Halogeometricum borinquense DSM 11551]ELY30289.1 hydrolase of the metallo-beta-lactamase superfamily protein [Halogeometricum borinquense DSM 11551]